jgi:hypothetical protein
MIRTQVLALNLVLRSERSLDTNFTACSRDIVLSTMED